MKTTKNTLKRGLLTLALLIAGTAISFAQCDKTVKLKSSVTNYVNDKGEIERSKDEDTEITLSPTQVTIIPGDHTLSGPVKDYVCNWTVPFKEGKTTFTAVLSGDDREMHASITIEGKDGKVVLTFTVAEMPGKKIQVTADKFE